MSREIKFRYIYECRKCGHIIANMKTLVDIEEDGAMDLGFHQCAEKDFNLYRIKDRLQFTGLHDTNEVDGYEGDIFEHLLYPEIPKRYVIKWDSDFPGFCIERAGDGAIIQLTSAWLKHSKIIGNIYENPELVEESK